MLLSDRDIGKRLEFDDTHPLRLRIEPFEPATKVKGQVGYGLSSAGYDVRLGWTFIEYDPVKDQMGQLWPLDPTNPDSLRPFKRVMHPHNLNNYILAPHGFVLAETVEWFRIPEDVAAQVIGKSTLCRVGINLNTSPLEPGWEGVVTLEIANLTDRPVVLRPGQGIGQVLFTQMTSPAMVPYNRKPGRSYQGQMGATLPVCPGTES